MRATIISADYGSYDGPKPICPQDDDVDWVFVTDNDDIDAPGWRVVFEPRPDLHPNRAAKTPKMLPWRYTDAPASVWIDASFEVISPTFARDVLAIANPIAQFVHPWRDCIYDEADHSVPLAKYAGELITEQMATYRYDLHPEHWGLWATGVIARHHTEPVRNFGHEWLRECTRWSYQDQLSEAPMLRAFNLRPDTIPGDYMTSPWLAHRPSVNH